ncbi:MAG: hypothetical protein RSC90_10685, partial [Clostridia bacterium]
MSGEKQGGIHLAESLGDSAFVRAPARADALAAFACPSAPPLCAGGQLAEDGTQGAPSALQCPDAPPLCAGGQLAEDGVQGAPSALQCPSARPLCADGRLAEDGAQGAPSALQCPSAQPLCAGGQLAEDGAQGAPSALARPGERIDDLQRDGLVILQRPGTFCFGTDSVLLADFAAPKKAERVADLGTGTGVLCLLM